MRLDELFDDEVMELIENRTAPLYHSMTVDKTVEVFAADKMEGLWQHDIPGMGKVSGTSLTRNKFLRMGRPVRLTFDQRLLNSRNKIVPLDGENAMRRTFGHTILPKGDRGHHSEHGMNITWSEEFVLGDIVPLHRYLTLIELRIADRYRSGEYVSPANAMELQAAAENYAGKYGIKLVLEPGFEQYIADAKARWAEEEEWED